MDTTEWLHFHLSLSCIGEGNGNPLQCSCLENPRAWWAAVYGVAQSRTWLKRLSSSSSILVIARISPLLPPVTFFSTCNFYRSECVPGSLSSVKREPPDLIKHAFFFVHKCSHFSDKNKLASLFYITFPEIHATNLKYFGNASRKSGLGSCLHFLQELLKSSRTAWIRERYLVQTITIQLKMLKVFCDLPRDL